MGEAGVTKDVFIKRVTGLKNLKAAVRDKDTGRVSWKPLKTVTKALKRYGNTGKFYEMGRTNLDNMFEGLREFGAFKDFSNKFRDVKGKFTGIPKNPDNYYVKGRYHYYDMPNGNKIVMDFSDSPRGVTMWEENAAGQEISERIFYAQGE